MKPFRGINFFVNTRKYFSFSLVRLVVLVLESRGLLRRPANRDFLRYGDYGLRTTTGRALSFLCSFGLSSAKIERLDCSMQQTKREEKGKQAKIFLLSRSFHNTVQIICMWSYLAGKASWFWSCPVACLTAVVVRQIDENLSVHFDWLKSLFHFERIKTLTRDLILVLINFIIFLPSSNHVTLLLSHLP